MYSVSKIVHEKYGKVVQITRDELGKINTPFEAFLKASHIRRIWNGKGKSKVRLLIDSQIMSISEADKWANDEYKSLPKCKECGNILNGKVYTHNLCGSNLFCKQSCADKNFNFEMEKLNDNEESEFDCS
jgi:hypothetical protein